MGKCNVLDDLTSAEIDCLDSKKFFEYQVNGIESKLSKCLEHERERQFSRAIYCTRIPIINFYNFVYLNYKKYPFLFKELENNICLTTYPKMESLEFISQLHDNLLEIEGLCISDEVNIKNIKSRLNKLRKSIPNP